MQLCCAQRVAYVWPLCSTMCNMLYDVGSSLKMIKFLLQHFGISQDVASSFTNLITPSYIVARYCVKMLHAFDWTFTHKPTSCGSSVWFRLANKLVTPPYLSRCYDLTLEVNVQKALQRHHYWKRLSPSLGDDFNKLSIRVGMKYFHRHHKFKQSRYSL